MYNSFVYDLYRAYRIVYYIVYVYKALMHEFQMLFLSMNRTVNGITTNSIINMLTCTAIALDKASNESERKTVHSFLSFYRIYTAVTILRVSCNDLHSMKRDVKHWLQQSPLFMANVWFILIVWRQHIAPSHLDSNRFRFKRMATRGGKSNADPTQFMVQYQFHLQRWTSERNFYCCWRWDDVVLSRLESHPEFWTPRSIRFD